MTLATAQQSSLLSDLEYPKLSKKQYEQRIAELQLELMKYQQVAYKTGARIVLVVEGTDTAGKGGMIKRLVEFMDPRGVQVYPIGAPDAKELSQHYLQRFWSRLPGAGQMVIFDRSWYGRVLVERVESLIDADVWQRAYTEINQFEQQLQDDGIILIKLFMAIDKSEQKGRLIARLDDPRKNWKITQDDLRSHEQWDAYQAAYEGMFQQTSTEGCPWHIVPANNKRYARVTALEHVLATFAEHLDLEHTQMIDPEFKARAREFLSR